MPSMWFRNDLPADFIDGPWYRRLWCHVEILLQRRAVKVECCESFRKVEKMRCCKGCATIYSPTAPNPLHRFLWRAAKKKAPKSLA